MSLIDDALRRAREESALQEAAKRPGSSRWAPSHIPRRRRPAWKAASAFAAVFLAGTAAAWLFLARNPGRSAPDPAARPSAPPPAAPVAAPAPAPPRKIEPPARTRVRRLPEGRSPAPGDAAPESSPALASPPASTAAAPPPAAGQRTFVHTATLSGGLTIELGGIVYSEGNPVALINGKVVAPGSLVGDFTVVQIRPERVDFSGNGTTFSILLH